VKIKVGMGCCFGYGFLEGFEAGCGLPASFEGGRGRF
jgi:hypothetical protein